jgi:hypothetical protein
MSSFKLLRRSASGFDERSTKRSSVQTSKERAGTRAKIILKGMYITRTMEPQDRGLCGEY